MKMEDVQPFLYSLSKAISELFGENCEITVHDLTKEYQNTIKVIQNGHVTGRKMGDGISEKLLSDINDTEKPMEDAYIYLSKTTGGRVVKSSSVYIHDKNGKVIGMFGINYDITELTMARKVIDSFISAKKPKEDEKIGIIATSVTDLLEKLIEQADNYIGIPIALMGKNDKINAIKYLEKCGAFLIKKAGDRVSKHYDISKYTLYNYLSVDN